MHGTNDTKKVPDTPGLQRPWRKADHLPHTVLTLRIVLPLPQLYYLTPRCTQQNLTMVHSAEVAFFRYLDLSRDDRTSP